MLINKITIIIYLCMIPVVVAAAADLGAIGQTYPIIEIDFLDFIQSRLSEMQKNGALQTIQRQIRENVNKHAVRPKPVEGITRATSNKIWLIDPSITVSHNLVDATGRTFVKAGTSINPLNYITIHHSMVFINADDAAQIKWLKGTFHDDIKNIKLVLVNGSITDMSKSLQQPVYFDQGGRLTKKFHIKHVPAIVSQEHKNLRVKEVAI